MNEIDITPLPYVCISPELGELMTVRFILKADVQIERRNDFLRHKADVGIFCEINPCPSMDRGQTL